MATALLGPELDIHCGGVDNIFPHHEAEIAQSECCTGKKFVRYWLHCAHLMVEGQKMSKSLGNFYTLRDLLEKGWTGREIRFALLTVNYRLPLNFTIAGLEGARAALARIDDWFLRLVEHGPAIVLSSTHGPIDWVDVFSTNASPVPETTELSIHEEKFSAALDDDLNISGAMGHLFDLIRESNRAMDNGSLSRGQAISILESWIRINSVLTLNPDTAAIPAEVTALVEERQQVRAAKNWKKSDELRDAITKLGWTVKDTKEGPKLTPLAG